MPRKERMNKEQLTLSRLKLATFLSTRRRAISGVGIAKSINVGESWVRAQLEKLHGLGLVDRPSRYKWIGKRTTSIHALRVALGVMMPETIKSESTQPDQTADKVQAVEQAQRVASLMERARKYDRIVATMGPTWVHTILGE